MNNGQMDRGNEIPTQHLPWRLRKTTKKPVRLVGTGIWTRGLPNASLVRYHGATSLGELRYYEAMSHTIWFIWRTCLIAPPPKFAPMQWFIYEVPIRKLDLKEYICYKKVRHKKIYRPTNKTIIRFIKMREWKKGELKCIQIRDFPQNSGHSIKSLD